MVTSYEINDEIAGVVPMASEAEQRALNIDVAKNGLLTPIVLWRGKVVDGRCRQIACIESDTEIRTTSLDWDLSEDQVMDIVKSLNTRRNLTVTQKTMSALRVYLSSKKSKSLKELALSWGIGQQTLLNANYIHTMRPEFIEPLFNGQSVLIKDARGNDVESNKINSICMYLRRVQEENNRLEISNPSEHEWSPNSYLTNQRSKDWYYETMQSINIPENKYRVGMLVAELAKYKFKDEIGE